MTPDTASMRFLVEEFIDVPDVDEVPPEAATKGITRMQALSARVLLPGPDRGGFSLQQSALVGMDPANFQKLRRSVRDWLRSVVTHSRIGHEHTLKGPLTMWLPVRSDLRAPLIEGSGLDVFWFYLYHLVARADWTRIGVCRAPKSKRDPGQQNPAFLGETEPCEQLFIRRGEAKEYCSDRCRARVATRRARSEPGRDGRKK